jgi:hypothetical protein
MFTKRTIILKRILYWLSCFQASISQKSGNVLTFSQSFLRTRYCFESFIILEFILIYRIFSVWSKISGILCRHQQCKMQTQRVVHLKLAWPQTIYQQVILYYVTFIFIQWHLEESIFVTNATVIENCVLLH